jgi:hypothetical protein
MNADNKTVSLGHLQALHSHRAAPLFILPADTDGKSGRRL